MSRKAQTLFGLLALLLAVASGYAVFSFFEQWTTTARVPVPNQVIPAGGLIDAALLTEREVPRALLDEPVYSRSSDLVGQVAQVPLQPGLVIYRAFVVSPAQYRLVEDPALVVAALPVDPARAVGGQVQPGHTLDLWQLPQRHTGLVADAAPLTPTLVLTNVRVVDVRSAAGQAVARQPQAVPGQVAGGATQAQQQALPLQILTVAVPVSQTQPLMALIAADQSNTAYLWVALAPLVRPALPDSSLPEPLLPLSTPTAAPVSPTRTPTPRPTPTGMPALDVRTVTGTAAAPLLVRAAPGGTVVGELPAGAAVLVLRGPALDAAGAAWYYITQHGDQAVTGWVLGDYLTEPTP